MMKTLVISDNDNGTWLAEHLGCTLFNKKQLCLNGKTPAPLSGKGIVTQVDIIDSSVWDVAFDLTGKCELPFKKVYGSSPLSIRIGTDTNYAMTILEGQGLNIAQVGQSGIQVGVMGWWENGHWIGKRAAVFEQFGFMNRELGIECLEPQGITIAVMPYECTLAKESLDKLDPILGSYNGPICMRLTVTSKGIWVRHARIGFEPSWLATSLELQKDSILDSPMNLMDTIAVGVLVSVPPYPLGGKEYLNTNIRITEQAVKHVRWLGTFKDGDTYKTTGKSGQCFYATAWGDERNGTGEVTKNARLRVYRSLRNIDMDVKQHRTDISSVVDSKIIDLREMGLL